MAKTKKAGNTAVEDRSATTDAQKLKAVELTVQQIEKEYGQGAIMKLGDKPNIKIESFSTGSLTLDMALGVGGLPRGRIIEIYGPEASGKTTIALHACAEAQKEGIVAFIDAEHALDPEYAAKLGVNIDELLVSQPDTGEQALEILDQLIRSSAIDLVIIDSVAALVPRSEIEGEMGDSLPGLQARLMSQALRKVAGIAARTGCTVLFINQLRQKIGISYGNPETTTGGNALKFYASVRLDIRRIETLKKGDEEYGNRCRVKVVKNKVAPPFRKAEFEIYYGQGISQMGELIDLGVKDNIIKKAGSWYSWIDPETGEEIKLGQGKDAVMAFLKENQAKQDILRAKIRAKFEGTDEESSEEDTDNEAE